MLNLSFATVLYVKAHTQTTAGKSRTHKRPLQVLFKALIFTAHLTLPFRLFENDTCLFRLPRSIPLHHAYPLVILPFAPPLNIHINLRAKHNSTWTFSKLPPNLFHRPRATQLSEDESVFYLVSHSASKTELSL